MSGRQITLIVEPDEVGERLDAYVARRTDLSRTRAQKLIDEGHVRLDGAPASRRSEPVWTGLEVKVEIPPAVTVDIAAEELPLDIVYEDAELVVLNKPAGMVVHPAPGHAGGTVVNALLHHVKDLSGVGGRLRPGIVHRLDRDTSGLLVAAKSDRAHHALTDALRQRKVRRLYLAVSWGHLAQSPVTVDAPIARDPKNRRKMAVVAGGRHAVTRARVRERWLAADLLDVALQTGRTHQIRVHLAHLGHPVVGDATYGAGWERGMGGPSRGWSQELARRTKRQFLHAAELAFDHPVSGERMRFRAPLPPELEEVAVWARETSSPHRGEASGAGPP